MHRKEKDSYSLKKENGIFTILINEEHPLKTPHGTVFHTPYKSIAEKVLEDLTEQGPESYKTGYSSLCHAFTYDNIMINGWYEDIKEEFITAPLEDDPSFMPGANGLPPARAVWNHIFYDENRPDDVREWIKSLSPLQLSTVLTVTQSTGNLNLAFVFGHLIIDEGDEGYLTDLENLFGNSWASFPIDDEDIDTMFEIFKVFYTAENKDEI